ncbi:GAF domain-containing protein [Capillimicrobium parvum]|uniref:Sensor-like histidine kinase SenX3 n=1 Tax=Capillimicrobium parvum TaxID=2884022 RepID=A0A9E6XUT0_9ACTN|nr:GAF domain-containing protein [Capillimicrobium parvum]UGS34774.1 Adaptive-response sensory-kinase SasA [Capillimicrobium parvum]
MLTHASRLLAIDLDYDETVSRVAFLLSGLADWCVVETVDTDGSCAQLAVAHDDPRKRALAEQMWQLYPPTADRPDLSRRLLKTGRPELVSDVSEGFLQSVAQTADHLRMLHELGLRSLLAVPLRTRGRVLGTILLANAESSKRFTEEDLEIAEDLARRAALAIDNAALHKSEQEARRRAERAAERIGRLQALTAALSRALTPTVVAEVMLGQGAVAVGADGGFVRLLTADASHLRLVATAGTSERFARSYSLVPIMSQLPDAVVFRSGVEGYFESAAELRAASSEFASLHEESGHQAVVFVPLHGFDGPIGVMALTFADARTFDGEDRELLTALADPCDQALERARLYEAERQARAAAELAIEQTTRLQRLAAELAAALTCAEVAEVVVTEGIASIDADASALQLLSADGTMLEVVCGKGSDRALIEAGWRRFPSDLRVPSGDALRTLEPVFIESNEDIREHYPDLDGYPHMRDAGAGTRARAGAHIPLIVSGQPLGVLFLGFSRARRFSEPQRSFVVALGRQCAQALKRAQLYETELEGRGRLSRLVERLHEGVVSVDARGHVEFASSTAKQMLCAASLKEGRPVPETWLGFPLADFVAALSDADQRVVEAQVASPDRARVFSLMGIPAAGSEAVLLVVTDVSASEQRRRVEREFIDNAAHELRTPLAAITSAIERLQAGAREDPERRDRFLGHIQHESARLNRLASSLLVLARAQTREAEPQREEIPVCGLLEELVSGLTLNPGIELRLDCPADLVVHSNRDLLEHAVLNLASNAARHTTSGAIGVSARLLDDDSVMLEVSDTGSGIAPEEFDRLFDRFYRGPREVRRAGFGLGLPITKEAVEAIGGRIEIDSIHGEGTTARIVLPAVDVTMEA